MPLLSKEASTEERPAGSIWEMFRTFFYAIGLALVFRSLLFEPFHIPSGSMRITLLEGDYLFVSKYSYGYSQYSFPFGSRLDWLEGRLAERRPERGDVIVFRLPKDTKIDYIKRLIGLPGDRIQMRDGVVYLNDKPLPQQAGDNVIFHEDGITTSLVTYMETLPNGKRYTTLDQHSYGNADNTPEFVVPEGHYFFMGDNRDNSTDSRFMNDVGFVPFENLIGRAEIILFSIDESAEFEFWEFWKYPSMFREGRWGKEII